MSPLLRKNDAKKTADYKWGRENTSEKYMSGGDNFLDGSSECFLYFHVNDHTQQGRTANHLACALYS